MIRGFEDAVLGMNVGESKTIRITPEQAYGPYRKELVITVPKSQLPADVKPQVGQRFQLSEPGGRVVGATVTKVSPTSITLDRNHQLAGKTLVFDIQLEEIL